MTTNDAAEAQAQAQPQTDRRRGDRVLRDIVDVEYRANTIWLGWIRLAATGLWFAVTVLAPMISEEFNGLAAVRPWAGLYFLYAATLSWGIRNRSPAVATFYRAVHACPDVAFIFFAQLAAIDGSTYPEAVAVFSIALFMAVYLPAPAGARRAPLFSAAVLSAVFETALLWDAGVRDWLWSLLAGIVLIISAFFGAHFAARFRAIAAEYARAKEAQLAAELRGDKA